MPVLTVVKIKELMGHASIVTTMRYIHATDQGKRGAITVLSEYRLMLVPVGKRPLHMLDLFFQRAFQAGVQPEACIEVLLRPRPVALKQPGQSPVSIGLGEEWIALDSQFVVGDAPVLVPSVQPRFEPIGCRY